jgi:hypothetical protein
LSTQKKPREITAATKKKHKGVDIHEASNQQNDRSNNSEQEKQQEKATRTN